VIDSADRGPESKPKARVFISYSRKDMGFADQLEAALKARGFEPLIDRTEIYAFEDWWRRIQALIVKADTVIFVLSSDAVSSPTCQKEVAFAASLNKRFAPVVCRSVDVASVPIELSRLNFISFEDEPQFESNAHKLADALSTDIEWIREHTEFGELARRWWEANPRPRGLLLRPPTLEEAERWIARPPKGAPAPTDATRSFIVESRKAETIARKRRRQIVALVGVLALMLLGVGAERWKPGSIVEPLTFAYHRGLREPYTWHVVMKPKVLTPQQERALAPKGEFSECAHGCPTMVVLPAGSFTMGSPKNENRRSDDEGPQHLVTFAKAFAVGKFDVTFDEWDACVDAGACALVTDNGWGNGDRPVIKVSWDDAKLYLAWLRRITGKDYRLLTEGEWEYAARAGTSTAYYWGDDIGKGNANCNGCGSQWDNKQTAPVGSFKPNAFGLYDMAGNVWQMLEDCYHGSYTGASSDGSAWTTEHCRDPVLRGGAWSAYPRALRAADRDFNAPDIRSSSHGFRLARTLSQ
jgi:formylglycine-generating enzyme required for sulfatase activity